MLAEGVHVPEMLVLFACASKRGCSFLCPHAVPLQQIAIFESLGTQTLCPMPILPALPLGDALFVDVPHTQALGCYTDCHNNTFCSNDPFSVSCYTVWDPLSDFDGRLHTPLLWQDSYKDDTARTTRSRAHSHL